MSIKIIKKLSEKYSLSFFIDAFKNRSSTFEIMHYAILAYGSRGDVQPFIALAIGLQNKGHSVTLAAPENFKSFVEEYGVTYFPVHGNMEALLHEPEAVKMLKAGSAISFVKHLQKAGDKTRTQVNEDLLKVCAKADVLITSTLNVFYVATIAEKLHKKWAMLIPNPPIVPTKEFPFPDFDFLNFPLYNILTYRFLIFVSWQVYKKRVNAFRISLGLCAATKNMLHLFDENKILTLYNFSPQLIHRPKDWKDQYKITGFLSLHNAVVNNYNNAELANWLKNGEMPVYIGFGSIPVPDPALLSTVLNEILASTNYRIVFCKGWSQLNSLPNHANLFVVDKVNHEWLLPNCKVAVFHGGAGTFAAVLKAKIPSVIVSIFGDQTMWGKIVVQKKIGAHIPFKKLTTKKLLDAVEETQTAAYRNNAFTIGGKINNENGTANAIEALQNYFQ